MKSVRMTGPRAGVILWIVFAVALVFSILMFSFNLIVRQRNVQAHAIYFSQVAYGLAESGANLAWKYLRDEYRKTDSKLFQDAVNRSVGELRGARLQVDLHRQTLAALTDGFYDTAMEVEARIVSARELGQLSFMTTGRDPGEKQLMIEVKSSAHCRGVRRELSETREVRVQADLLPVLSKFTLFVKEPESSDAASSGYNVFANDINGRPDLAASTNHLPLVLYNHGDTLARTRHDLETQGWVFLGGDRRIQLNLTSGADYKYGEYFHFYDFLKAREAKQAGFINDSPPAFFAGTYPVDGLQHSYVLKHVIYGYFTVDASNPPGSMNKNGLLERYFATGSTMRSGTLHLFGSCIAPSPTKVLGWVYHAYPIYTGITVDVDGDGRRDGLVSLLPAVERGDYDQIETKAPIPSSITDLRDPRRTISLDPSTLSYSRMFGSYETYEKYMSLLVEDEAYNTGLDYMESRGEFPPTAHVLDGQKDYPNPGTDVEIRLQGSAAGVQPYHKGDLNALDGEILKGRTFVEFKDARAFLDGCVRDGNLCLGGHVLIAAGSLTLPENLKVKKGGVIVCDGSISFDGITCEGDERLALVSLKENISSKFNYNGSAERPAQVDLVALNGRVGTSDPGHFVAIRGTVAAKRLLPQDFKAGGVIIYPKEADPTTVTRTRFVRVHLADLAQVWRF